MGRYDSMNFNGLNKYTSNGSVSPFWLQAVKDQRKEDEQYKERNSIRKEELEMLKQKLEIERMHELKLFEEKLKLEYKYRCTANGKLN